MNNYMVDPLPPIGNKHPPEGLLSWFLSASNVVPTSVPKTGVDVGYPYKMMLILAAMFSIQRQT